MAKSVQQCPSVARGFRCELVAGHKGKHSATAWKGGAMPQGTAGESKKGKSSLYWFGVSWVEITDKVCDCGKHGKQGKRGKHNEEEEE